MILPFTVLLLGLTGCGALMRLLFHLLDPPHLRYYSANKRWIKTLNRKELEKVFSHEDLLYRLSNDQMAALGDRLLELDK